MLHRVYDLLRKVFQILIYRGDELSVKADFKAFPSGEGGPLAVDEEIALQITILV